MMLAAHGWWIIGLGGAAGLAGLVATWRRLAGVPAARRVTLVGLRALALVCLLIFLANPTVERRQHVEDRPRVAVLVDRSASMGVKDAPGGASRIAWAAGLLRPGAPLAAALAKTESVVLLFADNVQPAPLPLSATADGPATDLQAALSAAMPAFAEGAPTAVVAVTDGSVNRGASRDELVALVGRRRVPLYCLGVGGETRPPDAWLARLEAPRSARAGATVTVRVGVGSRGLTGKPAAVALQAEGLGGGEKRTALADGRTQSLEFTLRPARPGLYRGTVRLAALPGEWTPANNSRTFFLRVTPGQSKLLFLAGRPGREFKFIHRVLDSLPDLRVTTLVRESGQGFRPEGSPPASAVRLPAGEGLTAQDAVILSDVSAAAFTAAELERLADFVRTRGGGLGMLGGGDSFGAGGFGGSPLAAALGVSLAGGAGYSPLAVKAQPTPDAATLSPTSDIARQDGFPGWAALPFLAGFNPATGVKPGAAVLLQGGPGQPLLVVQRYGLGRTLCWLSDSTFRWVLSKDATPASQKGHAVFWSGLVAWLTTPPNRSPVALETDRDTYESGDAARVIVHVTGAGFQGLSGADVTVEVAGDRGLTTRLRPTEVRGAPGRYESGFLTGAPGRYTLKARAALRGQELGSDTRQVAVEPPERELADPAQNVALLKALADASGGTYLPADRATDIERLIRLKPAERIVLTQHPWARSPLGLLAFLCLAGLDWLLRRWWGLG